ncbi:hypothetical protein HBH98_128150 [Parastagonospora nodorum]|nr:hypothetical protein HBI09_078800 [Parastagonospora nodorum]KAH4051696.1 hypothetical protein HBH49_106840 [Parastagonospora nodorum]KAH4344779.1 hypothetical protein HBH98_128150 [Parastagonospora nodorum]KAH4365157.1 hypothetical protein HBH97_174120 [Parastagonospora nodorum]KAH4383729.1 hypothetical protein HBH99_185020 [Parastagonospora nodorum]
MSTQQSPNDAGQSPSSSKTEENIAGNPERNRTLFPRVSPAPYDHEADAAAVAQMLANRPSFQPEPDRSKDTPTALFSDRQRWDPRKTIRHNNPPMIDDFAYRLSEAAARAANKGASSAARRLAKRSGQAGGQRILETLFRASRENPGEYQGP